MDYIQLGKNIRKYRKQRVLTQEQLSEKVDISPVFMSQIENAKSKPSLETVVKLAKALNISIDVLVDGKIVKKDMSNFINIDLTGEELNILKHVFKTRSKKEISALISAFSYLLDFK